MNTKIYSAPRTEVRKTRVRMSILAGSGSNELMKGSDLPYEDDNNGVRKRQVTVSLNDVFFD